MITCDEKAFCKHQRAICGVQLLGSRNLTPALFRTGRLPHPKPAVAFHDAVKRTGQLLAISVVFSVISRRNSTPERKSPFALKNILMRRKPGVDRASVESPRLVQAEEPELVARGPKGGIIHVHDESSPVSVFQGFPERVGTTDTAHGVRQKDSGMCPVEHFGFLRKQNVPNNEHKRVIQPVLDRKEVEDVRRGLSVEIRDPGTHSRPKPSDVRMDTFEASIPDIYECFGRRFGVVF